MADTADFHDLAGSFIAFRMDRSLIQRFISIGYSQEAGTLLEGLVTDLFDFLQLFPVNELAVGIAVFNDLLSTAGRQTGNVSQQFHGSGIKVSSGTVDAHHDGFIKSFIELLLRQVVLILADTD